MLDLDYLDLVFDCHEIDKLDAIKDNSLDVITLTNVLHHLKSPIEFLNRAASKLKSGGKVIATEPFFSALSTLIFKYLHHETVDFQDFRAGAWSCAGTTGLGQYRIAVANFFQETRLAATLE